MKFLKLFKILLVLQIILIGCEPDEPEPVDDFKKYYIYQASYSADNCDDNEETDVAYIDFQTWFGRSTFYSPFYYFGNWQENCSYNRYHDIPTSTTLGNSVGRQGGLVNFKFIYKTPFGLTQTDTITIALKLGQLCEDCTPDSLEFKFRDVVKGAHIASTIERQFEIP